MDQLYYCLDCEHSYEADEWERQEGDPPSEQCPRPKCKSLNTTTDPELMPQPDAKTYEKENPR